jgi:hypothetical protein
MKQGEKPKALNITVSKELAAITKFFKTSDGKQLLQNLVNDEKQQIDSYWKRWESLQYYLKKEGFILPTDVKDFFDWYLGEKYGHLSFAEALAKRVTDKDFLEYHAFREKKLSEPEPEANTDNIVLLHNGKFHSIEFDLSNVPEWMRYNAIKSRFNEMTFGNNEVYLKWFQSLKDYYLTIPKEFVAPALKKSIEYAEILHDFHLKHEHKNNYCKICESWIRRLELAKKLLNEIEPDSKKEDKKPLKSPVIALFTYLAYEAGLIQREETETVEAYCKAVCQKYNLPYTDKVRQNFYVSENKANLSKVRELILPAIDENSRKAIIEYLDNKADTKRKLYG